MIYAFIAWMQQDMRAKGSFLKFANTFEMPDDDSIGISKDELDDFIQDLDVDMYFH